MVFDVGRLVWGCFCRYLSDLVKSQFLGRADPLVCRYLSHLVLVGYTGPTNLRQLRINEGVGLPKCPGTDQTARRNSRGFLKIDLWALGALFQKHQFLHGHRVPLKKCPCNFRCSSLGMAKCPCICRMCFSKISARNPPAHTARGKNA